MAIQNLLNLEYNTQREKLIISEHGRHVQKLIDYAKTIKEDEKRQQFVEGIIELMSQMNPLNKRMVETKPRLWKHLFRISKYDLNVKPPQGIETTPIEVKDDSAHLPYPQRDFKFRHYGHFIQKLINKAIATEDPETKEGFVKVIAFYMKIAYKTWNNDPYVTDETIINDLKSLSNNKLSLPEDYVIKISRSNSYHLNNKANHRKNSKDNKKHKNRNRRKRS